MPTGQLEQFNCDGCGKQYRWKLELAGKRVKCKCGHTMTVPQPPAEPVEAESDDPFADALSAMAEAEHAGTTAVHDDLPRCPSCASEMPAGTAVCVQCGYNVNTGKVASAAAKKAKKGAVGMGVGSADGGAIAMAPSPAAAAATARRPGSTPLAYAGMPVRTARATANAGDNNIGHPVKDLFIPISLFVLGVALTFCEAWFGRGIANVSICLAYTGFTVVTNLVLVFVCIMLAVRLLSLGLGPIGPAMVKIAAISILPGALSGMLFHVLGPGGFFVVWLVNLVLIYGMFMGMLDLDFQETSICAVLIWLIRTWLSYLIVFALLTGLGMSTGGSGSSGAAIAAFSGPSSSKLKNPKPAKPKITPAQLDAKSLAALAQPGAMELRQWAAIMDKDHPHEMPRLFDIPTVKYVDSIYEDGAKKITVTRTNIPAHRDLVARQLVIELPDDKEQRAALFAWGKEITKEFTGWSQYDMGQKYLLVDFDGKPDPAELPGGQLPSDDEGDGGDTAPGQ